MGGTLSYESKGKGHGTTFNVSLLVTASDVSLKTPKPIKKTKYSKVLVASDNFTYMSLKSQI